MKGTQQYRITCAIHLHWTTNLTQKEIADRLGVKPATVSKYINEGPQSEEVRDAMQQRAIQVRIAAVQELKHQLKTVGSRSRSAEKPVKVWQDNNGDLMVRDVVTEGGELVDRQAVPASVEMLPDQDARFYARKEIRDILDQLVAITGAGEPDTLKIESEVEASLSDEDREALRDAFGSRRE